MQAWILKQLVVLREQKRASSDRITYSRLDWHTYILYGLPISRHIYITVIRHANSVS